MYPSLIQVLQPDASGLKRATLARLVLEHFLRNPDPAQLFEIPPHRAPQGPAA